MIWALAYLPYWILLALGIALFGVAIVATDDTDLDGSADVPWAVLGLGELPLLILLALDLSLWGVLGWSLSVFVAVTTGSVPSTGVAIAIFSFSLLISLWLGSIVARPVGKLFATFGEDTSSDRLLGCVGTVSSKLVPPVAEGSIGQVNLVDRQHNLVTVGAICPDWATQTPQYGQAVIAIDEHPRGYLVIVKDSPDEATWFSRRTHP